MNVDGLLTTAQACERAGIKRRQLSNWLAAGLPHYKPAPRCVLIDPEKLDAFAAVQRARRKIRKMPVAG